MENVMKKLMIAVMVAAALSGCSTIKNMTGQSEEKPKAVVSEFLGGNIKVTYKSDGEFESMTSSHSIKLTGGLPYSQDEAYQVAILKARKQMVEFMKVDLESEKFTKTVFNNLQQSTSEDRKETANTVNAKIAGELQSSIKQKSSAMLKGTYVEGKSYDASTNSITVVVKTSTKDVETAKSLSRLMGN
jgi:outer membrane protein assembly factor BamE (lipoprotein component of BamABCDE complex)